MQSSSRGVEHFIGILLIVEQSPEFQEPIQHKGVTLNCIEGLGRRGE